MVSEIIQVQSWRPELRRFSVYTVTDGCTCLPRALGSTYKLFLINLLSRSIYYNLVFNLMPTASKVSASEKDAN
jgi:hypothetical protein